MPERRTITTSLTAAVTAPYANTILLFCRLLWTKYKIKNKKGVQQRSRNQAPDASHHQVGSLSRRRGGKRLVPRENQVRGGAIRRRPGRRLGGRGRVFADEASWAVLRKTALLTLHLHIFSVVEETVTFVESLLFLDCDFFWGFETLWLSLFFQLRHTRVIGGIRVIRVLSGI